MNCAADEESRSITSIGDSLTNPSPRVVAITVVKEPLILAFQLPIELNAQDVRFTFAQAFRLPQIRPIELRVMAPFACSVASGVEHLALLRIAVLMPLQELPATVGEGDDMVAAIQRQRSMSPSRSRCRRSRSRTSKLS